MKSDSPKSVILTKLKELYANNQQNNSSITLQGKAKSNLSP